MTADPFVSFLLFSGGVGSRSKHHEPKQFFQLDGHPMIACSLMAANAVDRIGEVILNSPPGFEDRTRSIAARYCPSKPITVISGGETRQDSSLLLARSARYNTVLLHEAARPFVDAAMLEALIDCADANAGFCLPIAFSMCRVDNSTGQITKGVPRETVFNIQLPQKFTRETLIAAHERAASCGAVFTEDAVMVVDMVGEPVRALSGFSGNLKVTTPEDFLIAKMAIERAHL